MSGNEPDEPEYSEYCVRFGRRRRSAEVTIHSQWAYVYTVVDALVLLLLTARAFPLLASNSVVLAFNLH